MVIGCWSLVVSKQFTGGTQLRSMLGWWFNGADSLGCMQQKEPRASWKAIQCFFSGDAFFTSPFLSTPAPQWLCWPVCVLSHPCPPGINLHCTTGCPAWPCTWSYPQAFPGPDIPIKPPTHPHCWSLSFSLKLTWVFSAVSEHEFSSHSGVSSSGNIL